MKENCDRSGLSLVELAIAVAVLVLLAGMAVPKLASRMETSRDVVRIERMRVIQTAIERYFADHGVYPPAAADDEFAGWDASSCGEFIPELVRKGYLESVPHDPLDDADHNFRYIVYEQGEYGCRGQGPYYVLSVTRFENVEVAAQNAGYFKCSGRDWGEEFDFVTGGGTGLAP